MITITIRINGADGYNGQQLAIAAKLRQDKTRQDKTRQDKTLLREVLELFEIDSDSDDPWQLRQIAYNIQHISKDRYMSRRHDSS